MATRARSGSTTDFPADASASGTRSGSDGPAVESSGLYRLGRWCAARPWPVVAVWLVTVALLGSLAAVAGGELSDDIRVPGSEAERGLALIAEHSPGLDGAQALVVFHDPTGGAVTRPEAAEAIASTLGAVAELDGVTAVSDPRQPGLVSEDGNTVYVDVVYDRPVGDIGTAGAEDLRRTAVAAEAAGLEVAVGGELAFATSGAATGTAELIGLGVAVVVLILVFGTAVAAGLPLLMALISLGVTLAGVVLAASFTSVAAEAPEIAAMIGLGVGIDYALILLTRHREELRAGHAVPAAAALATATAGRSVLVAGGTVVVSVLALLVTGIPLIVSLGLTAAVVVVVAVSAALTLLPALLGLAGHRVLRRRHRVPGTGEAEVDGARGGTEDRHAIGDRGAWASWTRRVIRRPVPWLVGSIALLGVLAAPLASIQLSMPDGGSTAEDSSAREAYDLIGTEFGAGANGPVYVVAEIGTSDAAAVERLVDAVAADPGIARLGPPVPAPDGAALLLQAVPTTAPSAVKTQETIERLRTAVTDVLPAGTDVAVTGSTAVYADLTAALEKAMPVAMLTIVALSAVLLLLLFRSLVVALTAGLINILSIGAAFGVLVAVFQWGWGSAVFGVDPGPIASFAPLFLFAIVFGLSMDYAVFILARVREETLRSRDPYVGLTRGMTYTAQVITSAALIMVSVFTAFAFAQEPLLKLLGLGLAVAVALDATVVRLVLVPATVALLGRRFWWSPAWLDRILPRFDVEGPPATERHEERSQPADPVFL